VTRLPDAGSDCYPARVKGMRRYAFGLLAGAVAFTALSMSASASTAPGLGTATSFAVLAGQTVTNTGSTTITGDLGVSPGTAVTGSPTVIGSTHTGNDPVAISAQHDLGTAYGNAASSPCNFDETGKNLGGQTLTPGTYCQTTAPTLTGTLTLSGDGVFIFKAGSTLVTAPGSTVRLINGAQSCNVFWQVSSSATLDTTTTFVGTIMALTDISLKSGATIDGRALARNGEVSLISNQVTRPASCTAPTVSGPTASPTPSPTASPGTSPAPGIPRAGSGPTGGTPQNPGVPAILLAGSGALVIAGLGRPAWRRLGRHR
jgi:hypothetical protein